MRLLFKITRVYYAIFFTLTLLVLFPAFYFFLILVPNFKVAFLLKKFWAKILQLGFFIAFSKQGKENIPKNGRFIICANHSSYLDIILMYLVFDLPFIFMAKAELGKWPLFNIFFKGMDVLVNRKSLRDSVKAYDLCKERLDMGYSVVIFPEGTIPDTAPELGKFKAGAFKMAKECNAALLPITFTNNIGLIGRIGAKNFVCKPGKTKAIIHRAISQEEIQNLPLEEIKDITFARIQSGLKNV